MIRQYEVKITAVLTVDVCAEGEDPEKMRESVARQVADGAKKSLGEELPWTIRVKAKEVSLTEDDKDLPTLKTD